MPEPDRAQGSDHVWWRDGVLYQIYPRSYRDTDGDGVGDLPGIIENLDHLAWLGIEGIWLSPITVSPNDDWGYDVADYCDVDPSLGTLADAERLMTEAARRNIRVIVDLVPNHTSSRHPWFVDAISSRAANHRDYYVWADPKPDGSPPNNWVNVFNPGQPAWSFDEASGQYYLHQFLPTQPDLNWWNEAVREEFDEIFRFWFDRGVAGFRIDVCHSVVKDRELRDNPPASPEDHWYVQMYGQRFVYSACRPEVHEVIRRWRRIADSYDPPRILVGETYVFEPDRFASFYGNGDELNLAFNFMLLHAKFTAGELRGAVEHAEALLPEGCWPVWTGGNHDNHRFPTRWADGDPRKARAAMLMLMALRGTPFLYYGDEIGMLDGAVPEERTLDPVGKLFGPRLGRDPERTPMQWDASADGGFGSGRAGAAWLPVGDAARCNVADQRGDPSSMLNFTRDLIALRAAHSDLRRGSYTTVTAGDDLWVWRRGERTVVAMNMSEQPATVEVEGGSILIGTDRARDGEQVRGSLRLAAWEAVIVRDGER